MNISLRSYGATGNGTTDDTLAVKAAIAAMSSGDTLIVEPGIYILSDTIAFGDGSATTESSLNAFGVIGSGSGGGVHTPPYVPAGCSVFRWSPTGPQDRPMVKILGPLASMRMQGILFDGNNRAQDGCWDIYMHGSEWHDVYFTFCLRAHWFRTRWLTNPSGSEPFTEGASINTFVNCGVSGPALEGNATCWGMILGGNPTDPTDRTSSSVSDPFDSHYFGCRVRMDSTDNSVACELRYTDSNTFYGCTFVGKISVGVAQNPNFPGFPTAYMYGCFPAQNLYTSGYHMQTIGTIGSAPGFVHMIPIGDQANVPVGTYLPWLFATDEFGNPFFSGYKRRDILQAIERTSHLLAPTDTSFHAFPLASTFRVKQGDLYHGNFGGNQGQLGRIRLSGVLSTGTTPGSVRIQVLIGTNLLADTGPVTLNASLSNSQWTFDVEFAENTYDAAHNTVGLSQSKALMAFAGATATPAMRHGLLLGGGFTNGVPVGSDQAITVQASFSSPGSGNTITLILSSYELLWPDYQSVS